MTSGNFVKEGHRMPYLTPQNDPETNQNWSSCQSVPLIIRNDKEMTMKNEKGF